MYDSSEKMKAIYDAYRETLAFETNTKVFDELCVVSGEGSPDEVEEMIFDTIKGRFGWNP